MSSQLQVNHIADFDVDDAKEALVPFLEFALVEDLDGNHRTVLDGTGRRDRRENSACSAQSQVEAMDGVGGARTHMSKLSFQ